MPQACMPLWEAATDLKCRPPGTSRGVLPHSERALGKRDGVASIGRGGAAACGVAAAEERSAHSPQQNDLGGRAVEAAVVSLSGAVAYPPRAHVTGRTRRAVSSSSATSSCALQVRGGDLALLGAAIRCICSAAHHKPAHRREGISERVRKEVS